MNDLSESEAENSLRHFHSTLLNALPASPHPESFHYSSQRTIEVPHPGLLSFEQSEACKSDNEVSNFERMGAELKNMKISDDIEAHWDSQLKLSNLLMSRRRSHYVEDINAPILPKLNLKCSDEERSERLSFQHSLRSQFAAQNAAKLMFQKPTRAVPTQSLESSKISFERQPFSISPQISEVAPKRSNADQKYDFKQRVTAILIKLFRGEPISQQELEAAESDLWRRTLAALRKKYSLDLFEGKCNPIKPRRNEELFKFVLKKGFKRLFKNFKISSHGFVKGRKILDEEEFYKYYFFDQLNGNLEEMQACFLPGSKIQKAQAKGDKKLDQNVTIAYLYKLFTHQTFRSDFELFLTKDFVKDYLDSQKKKLKDIAEQINKSPATSSIKFPWTKSGIEIAKSAFATTFLNALPTN